MASRQLAEVEEQIYPSEIEGLCSIFSSTFYYLQCYNIIMFASSVVIIVGLLKAFLVDGNPSIKHHLYSRVANGDGQPVCSVNVPSTNIYGVRSISSCLLEHCVPTDACLSANYYADTVKCELFHYPPTDFFRIAEECTHFTVRGRKHHEVLKLIRMLIYE